MRTSEQEAALLAVSRWLEAKDDRQVFRLFGYAGTGKTSLAKTVASHVDGEVVFCAFTGKAVQVLRQKGCPDAATIHSLIYRPAFPEEGPPGFVLNRASRIKRASLVVVDEASMIDGDLGRDLLSFGAKVLVLGDPFQLPPVKGTGFFTQAAVPDVMLEEVHRQSADNPVIHLAMRVRQGGRLPPGKYGESRVIAGAPLGEDDLLAAHQVVVETNAQKRADNARVRNLHHRRTPTPEVGERLVCLRNDSRRGLMNGAMFVVDSLHPARGSFVEMSVRPEHGDEGAVRVSVPRASFRAPPNEPEPRVAASDAFDYGYALTVHKAQGSQWDSVAVHGNGSTFRGDGRRWLYTAITRAVSRVTVAV